MPLNNIMEDPDFQRFFPFFLAIKKKQQQNTQQNENKKTIEK